MACGEKPQVVVQKKFSAITEQRFNVKNGNPDSTQLSSFIERMYNSEGIEKKSIYFTTDSIIMMQFVNTYNNENKVKIDWINAEDKLVKYVKNSFDENGKITRSESFSQEGEFTSGFIHQWKENGKVEEKGPIEEGQPFKANATYFYNKKDDFRELHEFDENDSLYYIVKWEYKKEDEQGNWTERHMITNDTLNRIEKRLIKYQ